MTGDLFGHEPRDMRAFERLALRRGYSAVAGVDEAGRGALAGPVVAAAVILPVEGDFGGVDDSKKLTPARRDTLFDLIMGRALAVGVGVCDHDIIDRINILQATLEAMKLAVMQLAIEPDYLLIDGISAPAVSIPCRTIKQGDAASVSIAAASIVAKVTRDRMMCDLESTFPDYGFRIHKGYGSRAHLEAIARFGPCGVHRKTFRGVKEHLGDPA